MPLCVNTPCGINLWYTPLYIGPNLMIIISRIMFEVGNQVQSLWFGLLYLVTAKYLHCNALSCVM